MKRYNTVFYIDMPAERNIRRVAVCPVSNKFAVATKNYIKVWRYEDNLIELMHTIKVDFDIKIIDIYDEYVVFASSSEVRVVRVCVEKKRSDGKFIKIGHKKKKN